MRFRQIRPLLPRLIRAATLLATAAISLPTALAQPRSLETMPQRIELPAFGAPVNITTPWRFQQGDDVRYVDPNFDDSKWTVVSASKPLASYGFHDLDVVWYRKRLHVAPETHDLALMYLNVMGTWQMYVNGVQVSGYGRSIPGGDFTAPNAGTLPIPNSVLGNGDLTLAVRVSMRRFQSWDIATGGFSRFCFLRIGSVSEIASGFSLFRFQAFTSNTLNLLLKALLAILTLVLALTLRREREYLALLMFAAIQAFVEGFQVWDFFHNYPDSLPKSILRLLLRMAGYLAFIEFIRIVLRLRRSRLWIAYVVLFVAASLAEDLASWRYDFFGDGTRYPSLVFNFARLANAPFEYGLPLLALWVGVRQRSRDALLLFLPLSLNSAYTFFYALRDMLIYLHGPVLQLPVNPISGLYFGVEETTTFFYTLALLIFVVLRTVSIAGERARIAAEVEAARTMQRLLLARSSEPTPGFAVETVYLPAGEVGGDFFLVSPGSDRSLTAIVGDVSGKGLAAAMRVSMILGVLRREDSRDPATILARLNEALLAQSEAGFTTACCVWMDHEGRYTIANAGHISPYIAGAEVETLPAFPLGLAGEQVYEAVEGRLDFGERLVLMSDGVVEARSAKGELYGFERVASLSVKRAQEIAETAQEFGQDDDITVLTIACA